MTTVTAYEAKTHLPRLLRAAERGETVIITRHGKPVAQLGPVAGPQARRDRASHRTDEARAGAAPEGLTGRNTRVEARGPQVLMSVVLDSSIVGCWCFPDEASAVADAAMLEVAADEAVVPAVWWFEVRNLLLTGERVGRMDPVGTAEFPCRSRDAVDQDRPARRRAMSYWLSRERTG